MTTYHPLAVMGQFSQIQGLHSFEGFETFSFHIVAGIEDRLAQAYELWGQRKFSKFAYLYPGETFEYTAWIEGEMHLQTHCF